MISVLCGIFMYVLDLNIKRIVVSNKDKKEIVLKNYLLSYI